MSKTRLKAGVVGAGVFGGYHARKYAELDAARLVAIADASIEAARKTAHRYGAEALDDIAAFAERVDVATISTPATTHYAIARQLIDAGVHVLVEKPLAVTLDEADDLIARAKKQHVTLQVGHQERYVMAATGILSRQVPVRSIVSRRAGPWTGRCTDVDVVIDLMIHDLDLCHQLVDKPVLRIDSQGRSLHGGELDEVGANLVFRGGCRAQLFASRISDLRERSLRVDYADGFVEIDFIKRTMVNTTGDRLTPLGEGDAAQRAITGDPLGYAVAEFVNAVRAGREPLLNGPAGRRALATALLVLEAAREREAA